MVTGCNWHLGAFEHLPVVAEVNVLEQPALPLERFAFARTAAQFFASCEEALR